MRIELSNFNATTLRFSEKFDQSFSHIFVLGNKSNESEKIHIPIYPYLTSELVTNISTKPRLSGKMLTNLETYENGWSNFS